MDPEFVQKRFTEGAGIDLPLVRAHGGDFTAHRHLAHLGSALKESAPVEQSFSWQASQPTRKSAWFAARIKAPELLSTRDEISPFDGDKAAGELGLQLLRQSGTEGHVVRLRRIVDDALMSSARAVGVPEAYLSRMTIRYRAAFYEGENSGIGVHFDGNFLSAVATDQAGLTEIGYDGRMRAVPQSCISVMPGSSLYRMTRNRRQPFLPTFHAVAGRRSADAPKTTFVGFLNLPDREAIPGNLLGDEGARDFQHDINTMKHDDGPSGSIRHLWEQVASAHRTSVEDLATGNFHSDNSR